MEKGKRRGKKTTEKEEDSKKEEEEEMDMDKEKTKEGKTGRDGAPKREERERTHERTGKQTKERGQ